VYVGIDIGGSFVKVAWRGEKNSPPSFFLRPTHLVEDPGRWYEEIQKIFPAPVLRTLESGKLKGLGIGVPGEVRDPGVVVQSPNLPLWKNIPVALRLQEILGIPIYVENDAHMCALGILFLHERLPFPMENVVVITLGTGVGGGWIWNGRLYRQPFGGEMEVGHGIIVAGGRKCHCGRRGCVEAYVGTYSLLEQYKERTGKELKNLKELKKEAEKGDPVSREIFYEMGEALGIACAWCTNLLATTEFVIAGGGSFARKWFYSSLRESYRRYAFGTFRKKTRFHFPPFRDRLGALGALFAAETEGKYRQ